MTWNIYVGVALVLIGLIIAAYSRSSAKAAGETNFAFMVFFLGIIIALGPQLLGVFYSNN
jgi:hypothetical protein